MKCTGCGENQFIIDESTGRYVCTSCWQVSDFLEGLTQEDYSDTRGTRAIASLVPPSFSQIDSHAQPSQLFGGTSDAAVIWPSQALPSRTIKLEEEKQEVREENYEAFVKRIKAEEEIGATGVRPHRIEHTKIAKPRREHRPWRLSEAFMLVLTHQFKELLRVNFKTEGVEGSLLASRFRQTTWNLWTNYIAITGELGPSAWALAFLDVAKETQALLQSREEYVDSVWGRCGRTVFLPYLGKSEEPSQMRLRPRRKEDCFIPPAVQGSATLWSAVQLQLGSFQWPGWGVLYNPDDPSAYTDAMVLSQLSAAVKSPTIKHKAEVTPRSPVLGEEVDDMKLEDGEEDDGFTDMWDLQSIASSHTMFHLTHPDMQNDEVFQKEEAVPSLELAWKESLIEKMSKPIPRRDIFWRGQTARGNQRFLLEYNLAILFISSLLTLSSPVIARVENTDMEIHVVKRGFLTLSDLHSACKKKTFPFMTADNFLKSHFVMHDFGIVQLFRRGSPPNMHVLAHVSWLLIHMLGIKERPKLPLCSMVHRYLRELQFPADAHQLANVLIRRLGRAATRAWRVKGLHYWLPLARYVRGEVHAMAVVVVIARLFFKLNSHFEYCWSNVGRFLAERPKVKQTVDELVDRSGGSAFSCPPFIWSDWASSVDSYFSRTMAVPLTKKTTGGASAQLQGQSDPVNVASTFSDLQPLQTAAEFLGHSEFDVYTQRGWGEQQGTQAGRCRLVSQLETKLSLTNPLSNVLAEQRSPPLPSPNVFHIKPEGTTPKIGQSDSPNLSTFFCSYCERDEKLSFIKRPGSCREVVNSSCHALLAAHRLLHDNGVSASSFLTNVFTQVSASDAHSAVYDDWLHILDSFDSYEPISNLDFSTNRSANDAQVDDDTVPRRHPQVDRYVRLHGRRVQHFLSRGPSEFALTSDTLNGPSEDKDVYNMDVDDLSETTESSSSKPTGQSPGVSLIWFLSLACRTCGAANQQSLLLEVENVEWFLDLIELNNAANTRFAIRKMKHLALATAFDYTVCN